MKNTELEYFSVVYRAFFPLSSSVEDYAGNNH